MSRRGTTAAAIGTRQDDGQFRLR